MARELIRSSGFVRAAIRYLKKHPMAAAVLEETVERLAIDPFDARLKTHKLTGKLAGVWACSAGYDLRFSSSFSAMATQKRFYC